MRVEEVVSSFIMCIVSGLVLVGFTIAWYTNQNLPAVTGMEMMAAEMGDVKVALESGGEDISKLEGDAKYADMGMEAYDALNPSKLAPGTYGKVTFYVTPTQSNVVSCEIIPMVRITQDGSTWYPDVSAGDVSDGDSAFGSAGDNEVSGDVSSGDAVTMKVLYEIAQEHIAFFSDETMQTKITADAPYIETWTLEERLEEEPIEKKVDLYWKWYYEYPFTEDQLEGEDALSDAEQKAYIRAYDEEDMTFGNNLSGMKFYFTFSAK